MIHFYKTTNGFLFSALIVFGANSDWGYMNPLHIWDLSEMSFLGHSTAKLKSIFISLGSIAVLKECSLWYSRKFKISVIVLTNITVSHKLKYCFEIRHSVKYMLNMYTSYLQNQNIEYKTLRNSH